MPQDTTTETASQPTNLPAERWTEALIAEGFIPVSRIFLRFYGRLRPKLTPQEALFIIHLMDFKRDARYPYPSYKRVASYMGVSDKMVRNYAKNLEKKGYLRRVMRLSRPNAFDLTLLFTRLEAAVGEAEQRRTDRDDDDDDDDADS